MYVRIGVRGELDDAVREELEGFVERPTPGGRILWGTVPDQSALLGVLRRLHLAGTVIEDVEQVHRQDSANGDKAPGLAVARIQVGGLVADYLSDEFKSVFLSDPVTTTIEVRVSDQDAFFGVLARLEALALEVQEIHVRPECVSASA